VAAALAAAAFVLLAPSRFAVVGGWQGIVHPPGPLRFALAAAAGAAVAWVVARRAPGLRPLVLWLGLAAAPLVPVATGRFLFLLALQGPMLFVLGAALFAVALVRAGGGRLWRAPRAPALFVAALAAYLALGAFLPGAAGPQGDEPHYLLMAHSLWTDGDLDLADDYGGQEYRAFYADTLEPHLSRNRRGGAYSNHMPGLGLLLLPGYALAGFDGARAVLAALVALSGVIVHRVARDVLRAPGPALGAWAAYALTPPVAFYAVSAYPETATLLPVALFLLAARGDLTIGRAVAAGLAAGALPWLHTKFAPLALAGLALTLARPARWRARAAGLAAFAVPLAALALFLRRHYGHVALTAASGPAALFVDQVPFGLMGLFLDRQYGLFLASPVWLLSLPGLALLARWRTGDALRAALLAAVPVAVAAPFDAWWGGACPPARYLVPALPALAVALAPALVRWRTASAALWGASAATVLLAGHAPRALHNRPDGDSALLRFLSPAVALDAALPSYVSREGEDARAAPGLGGTLLAAASLGWAAGGPGVAAGAAAYAVTASALGHAPDVDVRRAGAALVMEWEPAAFVPAFDPRGLRLPLDLPRAPWALGPREQRRSRRLDVPPGAYRVTVDAEGGGVARLDLEAGDLFLLDAALPAERTVALFLPVGARRLGLAVTGERGVVRVRGATLVPEDVAPRGARDGLRWPRAPSREVYRVDVGGALRLTVVDGGAPDGEGYRLESEAASFVLDGPPGGRAVLRVAREAPAPRDAVRHGGREVPLGPARQAALEVPLDGGILLGGRRVLPVEIRARGGWAAFALR
jgi:hypothetical protein